MDTQITAATAATTHTDSMNGTPMARTEPSFMDLTTWRPRLDPATLSSLSVLSIPPEPVPVESSPIGGGKSGRTSSCAKAAGRRRKASDSSNPSVIHVDDVPGGIGMSRLLDEDVLTSLDDECGYVNDQADTLYGRALIANRMVPFGSIAAGMLAAWVWVGGDFPHRLDMIANSHYRTLVHGRQITVYNRRTPADHVMQLGKLRITSPLRTICDIACMDEGDKIRANAETLLPMLMERYEVRVEACLQALWENPRWPNHSCGVHTLMRLRHRKP